MNFFSFFLEIKHLFKRFFKWYVFSLHEKKGTF
jgi:hypothetical protein